MESKSLNSPVLLTAFHSFAGMGPYVISIVNSFNKEDNILFFLVEGEDHYYSKNIKDELKDKGVILSAPTPSLIKTLLYTLSGFKFRYRKELKKYCSDNNISVVHDLTGYIDCGLVDEIKKNIPWLYTVHDLHPHEANKVFYKLWKQKKLYANTFRCIDNCKFLVTNSDSQYAELKRKYPRKDCFKTPFPSLITKTVKQGGLETPELKGCNDYILFFGRIEEYKGLSVLTEAFRKIDANIKLVIAGGGELRCNVDDERIILVNRYIDDREIANLYQNSKFVVYPYLSATQSGVLAVASYFKTPIIASDVPFFREVLGENYIGLFKTRDIDDLANKLKEFIDMPESYYLSLKEKMTEVYSSNYEDLKQRELLLEIYNKIK